MSTDPKSQRGDQKGVGAENDSRDPAADPDKDTYPPNVTREKTRDPGVGDTVTDESRDPRRPQR
jgi:hypothetical protein